jgi:hypothetical protein
MDFKLKVKTVLSYQEKDDFYYVAVVSCNDFPSTIPLDANLREPRKTSKVYQNIVDTLIEEPRSFFGSNSGIRIIASNCEIRSNQDSRFLTFKVDKGQGITNGGHTYQAIFTAKRNDANISEASVLLIVHVSLNSLDIAKFSSRLNTSTKVDNRSLRFKQYVFKDIQAKLEEHRYHYVSYYQNQKYSLSKPELNISEDSRCKINHIICMCDLLDQRFKTSNHPINHAIGGNVAEGKYALERALLMFDNCFDDLFFIEKEIYKLAYDFLQKKPEYQVNGFMLFDTDGSKNRKKTNLNEYVKAVHLIDGSIFNLTVSRGFSFPIIACYRIFYNPVKRDWQIPFEEFGIELLAILWETYQKIIISAKKDKKTMRLIIGDINNWSILYNKAVDYKLSLPRYNK